MSGWKTAFVAVAAIVGEPLDVVRASVPDIDQGAPGDLLRALESGSREERAEILAAALADVARDLDRLRLT